MKMLPIQDAPYAHDADSDAASGAAPMPSVKALAAQSGAKATEDRLAAAHRARDTIDQKYAGESSSLAAMLDKLKADAAVAAAKAAELSNRWCARMWGTLSKMWTPDYLLRPLSLSSYNSSPNNNKG